MAHTVQGEGKKNEKKYGQSNPLGLRRFQKPHHTPHMEVYIRTGPAKSDLDQPTNQYYRAKGELPK